MNTARRALAMLLITLFTLNTIAAQDSKTITPPSTSLVITAAASRGRVRFTAPSQVVQMHLEIYSEAGEKLFDTVQSGSVMDYLTMDKAGEQLPDAAYLCVVTVKTVGGKLSQKVGMLVMQAQQVSVRLGMAQPTAAQAQAVGPLEENSALTVMAEGNAPATTVLAHDGQNGQVTSSVGALTFRTGDVFAGKETEQMRLTEEGNLGIGTDNPTARLDVNGMIRARQGFQFSDGSILELAPKGGLRMTLPSGKTLPVVGAPSVVAGTANRIPKFAPDGSSLLDSAIYQDPNNGYIGIGTTTPLHPFVVRRNGGTMGVHTVGELFVDRDDRGRSASLTVGTAGTLKWIFGMPSGGDGFQVYDLTNNASRFFVDPTSGSIGIGTNSPNSKLHVVNANANSAIFGDSVSGPGVYGKSASSRGVFGESNTFYGVYGLSHSTNAAGVYGINDAGGPGVLGEVQSRGSIAVRASGTSWFQGDTTPLPASAGKGIAIGFAGEQGYISSFDYNAFAPKDLLLNLGGGNVGVNTRFPRGALDVGGNVLQNFNANGVVKAMLYVGFNGSIVRCYNGNVNTSSGNCGFTIAKPLDGVYRINFGFPVSDRFVSITPQYFTNLSAGFAHNAGANFRFFDNTSVEVYTFAADDSDDTGDTSFMIILY